MSQNTTLVNNFYPLDYFALTGLNQPQAVDPRNFWASEEKLAPASDYLIFNLGLLRPINFLDFEISGKPIDIVIEYDSSGVWKKIVDDPAFDNQQSVTYLPSQSNSWVYIERHFSVVQTQKIRITFNRRTNAFPFSNSDPFPWSIEVKNSRLMNLIDQSSEFIADSGTDVLGNSYRTEMHIYSPSNLLLGQS